MAGLPGVEKLPPELAPFAESVGNSSMDEVVARIPEKSLNRVRIPVGVSIQEAYNIVAFAEDDREDLVARGLDWEVVKEIPHRCEYLRRLESRYWKVRFGLQPVNERFKQCEKDAKRICKELVQDMKFAFDGDKRLTRTLSELREGKGVQEFTFYMDAICALAQREASKLSDVGSEHGLEERLAQCAQEYPRLHFQAAEEASANERVRGMRNRARVFLYVAIREIQWRANNAFRHDYEHLKGYTSDYQRRSVPRQRR